MQYKVRTVFCWT